MTGGIENIRLHGVLMMRNNEYERAELLQIGGNSNTRNTGSISREKVEDPCCVTCQDKITARYLLQVNGSHYHTECLRCYVCSISLATETSCFIRDNRVYCKADYYRTYGSAQCAKCGRWISSTDWVRRARDSSAEQIYHLACFACDACHRQLSTGEEFALVEKKLLCKTHYQETCESDEQETDENDDNEDTKSGGEGSSSSRVGGTSSSRNKSKTKRVRTTFTDEQLQILQANFQIDSNPDGQDLERIAQITGLSKRVTQVWFQNSRARQKKHHHCGGSSGNTNKHMNNNSPSLCNASGSSSPTIHHHHYVHATHHVSHHQQQISRVLTRDTLSSNSPSSHNVE